jgi:TonB family protein
MASPMRHLDPSSTSAGSRNKSFHDFNLGVVWASPWREFGTSVRDFFSGPSPVKESESPTDPVLRVDWIRGRLPGRAFLASSLWHAAAVLILILPIWGFLPKTEQTLAPVQIEVTYVPAQDLPRISLPAPSPKPNSAAKMAEDSSKPVPQAGADSYHPRQTILSIPVQVTHPRQTLIQPDASPSAPKIDVQLPNIVQWTAAPARPQLQLSPTPAAPSVRKHVEHEVAAPDIANNEKNSGAINIAAMAPVNPQPQMPMNSMSAAVAQQRQARPDATAAPEIGAAANDANLHRLIALSATPGPPAPEVSVPQENLAARISISPEGKNPGTPGGAERSSSNGGSGGGAAPTPGPSSSAGIAGNASSLPAAISVSGGNSRGGIAPAGIAPGKLNLKPTIPNLAPSRKGPSVVGAIDPSVPPEQILSGKEVYTLNINLPNLTSIAGSWIVSFAQLDETDTPPYKPRGRLSGPVPVEKVDPKYPPQLIKEHVEGQVVLYAIIEKDGGVRGVQLVHGVESELDKDAMEAFAQWKFRPGTRDGVPVDLEAVVFIPFRYRPPE